LVVENFRVQQDYGPVVSWQYALVKESLTPAIGLPRLNTQKFYDCGLGRALQAGSLEVPGIGSAWSGRAAVGMLKMVYEQKLPSEILHNSPDDLLEIFNRREYTAGSSTHASKHPSVAKNFREWWITSP
jgi:hypothetical protein